MTPAEMKAAREALRMTPAQIAVRLDCTPTTWYRWETGRTAPQHPAMLRLALERLGGLRRASPRSGVTKTPW